MVNNTQILVGIVIKTDKVRENDIRVRVLSAEGLMTFTATGAAKPTAKLKNAVQIFTLAEFSVIGHRLIGAHVLQSNHAITKDIKRYYLACAIVEVVAACYGTNEVGNGFLLTVKALDALNVDYADTRAIFTEYFSGLLLELGYGCEDDEDISSAFIRNLDIKIPNTKFFL